MKSLADSQFGKRYGSGSRSRRQFSENNRNTFSPGPRGLWPRINYPSVSVFLLSFPLSSSASQSISLRLHPKTTVSSRTLFSTIYSRVTRQHTPTQIARMDVTSYMYPHIHPVLQLNRDLAQFGVFVAVTDVQGVEHMQRTFQAQPAAGGHRMAVLPLADLDGPARVALFCRNLPALLLPLRVFIIRAHGVEITFADVESALFALRYRRPIFMVGYWAAAPVSAMFFS
ncbi:hypothetical protein B0T26DRAFT_713655 [Lasiosphaeria miniovina]|uniref:Uncharacterized protein n=1 Tax=Lasiosphaeria miniovina TaxID=1954250 RepID=A0AA40AMI0_9PEZI|nr:uncharacterized protein B0T26DRAFT_713655 [Lasiosphaeria miniovina]KAK0718586.1 hypothetical protein B0T26DRAFT_713655 [Lasiosphaeria miniovina]